MELEDHVGVCGSKLGNNKAHTRRDRAEAARDGSPCVWERETVDFGDWVRADERLAQGSLNRGRDRVPCRSLRPNIDLGTGWAFNKHF